MSPPTTNDPLTGPAIPEPAAATLESIGPHPHAVSDSARDPATLVSGLLAEGRVAEADAALDRLGHAAAHSDGLLPLRAITAARLGDAPGALAAAWSAAERLPREASLQLLLARALEACGATALSLDRFERAAQQDPENVEAQRAWLRRLSTRDPARTRARLPDLLRLLDAGDAPLAEPVATALGLDVWGSCRREGSRIRLWTAGDPARRTRVTARVPQPGGARSLPADIAFRRRKAPDGILALEAEWPDGAETLALVWTRDGTPLPGSPLRRPVPGPQPPRGVPPALSDTVDVIVPVHGGYAETLACLASVLAARCVTPHEIVVVDDATPDHRLATRLARMEAEGQIRLISHPANRGFTAAANHGLALHPDRDAVLLNADTVVPPGWLDRLVDAARREPRAGTVTPLTNHGQLVSFPRPYRVNPMPDRAALARLDATAARENAGRAPDLPVGAGFCLLIRRACLAEVGPLDEQVFGRGYGEETDFCLRALRYGWRNLCAADVYVAHHGGQSFGGEKAVLVKRNMAAVERRHPVYRPLLDAFDADDPLAEHRRRIERAVLRPLGRGAVLAVGPPDWRRFTGLRHLRARLGALRRPVRWLRPAPALGPGRVALEGAGADGPANLVYRLPAEWDLLRDDISRLAPARLALATLDLPPPMLRFLSALDLPISLHVTDAHAMELLSDPMLGGEAGASAAGFLERSVAVEVSSRHAAAQLSAVAGQRLVEAPPAPVRRPDTWPEGLAHPGQVAVVSGVETARGQGLVHALATAAPGSMRFFVMGAALEPAVLARTGAVQVLGPVTDEVRAQLASALGARVALAIAPDADPTGLAFDIAAETCPAVVAVGGPALAERAEGHPSARLLGAGAPVHDVLEALKDAMR